METLLRHLILILDTMSFHIDQFLIPDDPVLNPIIRDWVNDSLNDLTEFGDKMNEGNIIARYFI